jgi:filamentous hemagglutinin family protein
VAVAEIVGGRGKTHSVQAGRAAEKSNTGPSLPLLVISVALCLLSGSAWSLDTNALPSGGKVVAGAAAISQSANTLTVQQHSTRAALDWQSFNIGSGATVNFVQPNSSSVALNRILGNEASQIYGRLNANGQVFFSNPNGMLFGAGSQVNVGSLLATTMAMDLPQFMTGNPGLTDPGTGTVRNEGLISAAGSVVLAGNTVANVGQILATNAALVAGNTVALDVSADGLIRARVTDAAVAANLSNSGSIESRSQVLVSAGQARAALASVVNNSGVIRASGMTVNAAGEIELLGGTTVNSGVLDASSAIGHGGRVAVQGQSVSLEDAARVDASGATGGGKVLIGGGRQGKDGSVVNAHDTTVSTLAQIHADATQNGNGGTVVVWSDGTTRMDGQASARGGAPGGDGGFIETSGKQVLQVTQAADVSAPAGKGGVWLLDPFDLTVVATQTAPTLDLSGLLSTSETFTAVANNSTITNTVIQTALESGTSVVLSTDGAGVGAHLTVSAPISAAVTGTGTSLTLDATGAIAINQPITSTGTALGLNLNHGTASSAIVTTALTLAGGDLKVGTFDGSTGAVTVGAGNVTFSGIAAYSVGVLSAQSVTLNTGTLNIAGTSTLGSLTMAGGSLTNTGALTVNGPFNVTGTSFLGGTGSVATQGTSSLNMTEANGYLAIYGGKTWTNYGTADIGGDDFIYLGYTTGGVNSAINASGAVMNISSTNATPVNIYTGTGSITNYGTFNKIGPTTAALGSNIVGTNNGTINVQAGTLVFSASGPSNAGIINISSGATAVAGSAGGFGNAATGVIQGTGTMSIPSGFLFNEGTISPGISSTVGTLTIAGNLFNTSTSSLAFKLGGPTGGQSDKLSVTGSLTLNGTLNTALFGSYVPSVADAISLITHTGTSAGNFAYTALPVGFSAGYRQAAGETLRVIYSTVFSDVFTNAGGGFNWENPANWSMSALPGATTNAVISSGYAVSHSFGTDNVGFLTINSGSTLNLTGGSLNVLSTTALDGTLNVSGGGSLTLNGALIGALSGHLAMNSGNLTLNGATSLNALNFTSSTLHGNGRLNVNGSFSASNSNMSASLTSVSLTQTTGDLTLFNTSLDAGQVALNASAGNIAVDGSYIATRTGPMTVNASGNVTLSANTSFPANLDAYGGGQTITAGGTLNLLAYSSGTNLFAQIANNSGGNLTVTAANINMQAGGDASGSGSVENSTRILNYAYNSGLGGQVITLTGPSATLNMTGGSGTGNSAYTPNIVDSHNVAVIAQEAGGNQSVNFTQGGTLSMTGGTTGSGNQAIIRYNGTSGTQTIGGSTSANYPIIVMTGGASGGAYDVTTGNIAFNHAVIYSSTSQVVDAQSITMTGGTANYGGAHIWSPQQTVVVNGNVHLTGGSSNQPTDFPGNPETFKGVNYGYSTEAGIYATGTKLSDSITVGGVLQLTPGTGTAGTVGISTQTAIAGSVTAASIVVDSGNSVAWAGSPMTTPGTATVNGKLDGWALTANTLTMGSGSDALLGDVTVANLNLQAGTLGGDGTLTVSTAFSRTAGTIATGFAALSLTQATGNLLINGNLDAGQITLNAMAGNITVDSAYVASRTGPMSVSASGDINLLGNTQMAGLEAFGGQTVTAGGTLTLQSAASGNNLGAWLTNNGGNQTVSAANIALYARGGTGSYKNEAGIENLAYNNINGNQTITLTSSNANLTITGGDGTGNSGRTPNIVDSRNDAYIIQEIAGNQTITFNLGGTLSMTGGTAGSGNNALIWHGGASGSQTITGVSSAYYPNIVLNGGATGGTYDTTTGKSANNDSSIDAANAVQLVNAQSINLYAGTANYSGARILAPQQTVVVNGNVHLTGGSSSALTDFPGDQFTYNGTVYGWAGQAAINATRAKISESISIGGQLQLTPGTGTSGSVGIGQVAVGSVTAGSIVVDAGTGTAYANSSLVTAGTATINGTLFANAGFTANTLTVAGSGDAWLNSGATLANLNLQAGSLNGGGTLAVSNAFSQSAGALGNGFSTLSLTQTSGALVVNGSLNAGNILLRGNGVTLGASALVGATGTGTALVVDAGAGNFINNDVTTAPLSAINGRWLVYSASPVGIVKGGVISNFRHYGGTYTSYAPSGVSEAGNGFVYASAVAGQLTVTPTIQSGTTSNVYGVSPTLGLGYTLTGFVDSEDTLSNIGLGGAIAYSFTPGFKTNVGSYTIDYLSGLTNTSGYTFAAGQGLGYSVSPATLSIAATAASKTYDGTNVSSALPIVSGLVSGDTIGSLAQSFGSIHALGTGASTLSINGGYVINDGNNGNNYTVQNSAASGTINPATITATVGGTTTKTYDGGTSAGGATVGLSGAIAGDTLTVSGVTLAYSSRNAGANSILAIGTPSLGISTSSAGSVASDYVLSGSAVAPATATISQLTAVAWTGAAGNSNWSDAANWSGGAIPDASNVAIVTIPTGASVVFDAATAATFLTSLTVNGSYDPGVTAPTVANLSFNSGIAGTALAAAYSATQSITINSGGAISDTTAGSQPTLTAPTVSLSAASGISSASNAVKLATSNLSATTATGTLQVTNTPTTAVNVSTLTTGDASVVVYKQNGLALNLSGSVQSNGGSVVFDPPATLSMAAGSSIASNGGSISLTANGNMTLATVNASGANGAGNVSLTATSGGISSATPGTNNITAGALTLAAAGNVQLAYAATSVDTRQVLGLMSSPAGVLPVIAPAISPTTVTTATAAASSAVQSATALTLSAPAVSSDPTLVVDPAVLSDPTLAPIGGSPSTTAATDSTTTATTDPTLVVDPAAVVDAMQTSTTASSDTTTTSSSATTATSATANSNTVAAATDPVAVPQLYVMTSIAVANSLIQKPLDQVMFTNAPKGQTMVCR